MLFDEYNELLNRELGKFGLNHGFEMYTEGEFCRHLIYVDMGVESKLWGLAKKPRRKLVAKIISEPNSIVPFMQGAVKGPGIRCLLIDQTYADAVQSAVDAVNRLVSCGGSTVFPPSKINIIGWI